MNSMNFNTQGIKYLLYTYIVIWFSEKGKMCAITGKNAGDLEFQFNR